MHMHILFYSYLCIYPTFVYRENFLQRNTLIFFTERLLKGAEEGDLDEVVSSLENGVDIESKDQVRLID